MQDLFSGFLISVLGAVVFVGLAQRYNARELGLFALAYAAHVGAGFAQVLITKGLYGSGDIFGYARRGEELAAALSLDFQGMAWEMLKLLFHQDAMLPITMSGIGTSTGSMSAIAGFITYFTGGGVYAGCILLGIAGFYGKLAVYEVFRLSYPENLHQRLLVACMLVPSVVFWSSGILKESVAIAGLGPVMLGVHRMLNGRKLTGLLLLSFGALAIGLVKAYILFALVVAAAAWVYAALAWKGRAPSLRPMHLALGLAVAIGGLMLLGKLFPQYALDAIAEQAVHHQEVGQRVRGGSTYELVGEGTEASLLAQLLYAPLALLTSLYRPLIFEANSAQMLVNALETTAFLGMTLWLLWRIPLRVIWSTIVESPVAIFSIVFVGTFGVAVGLTTTNLGTLSRYRAPLVPMFASLLVVLVAARSKIQPAPVASPLTRLHRRPDPRPSARPNARSAG